MTERNPEYKTVKETADGWGVTKRWINMCIAQGRIPGTVKMGNMWLVPTDAEKPASKHGEKKEKSLSHELAEVLAATWIPAPCDNPIAIFDGIKEGEEQRMVIENSFAYAMGDFETVKRRFLEIKGRDAVKLAAGSIAIATAIGMGDYPFYLHIESYLKKIVAANISADVTAFAELTLAGAYLGAGAYNMAPDWLKNGDFTALPDKAKRNAAFMRTQYFRWQGNYELTLAVAQTSLAFCADDGLTFEETNLRMLCAAACYALGRVNDAEKYLLDAMDKHLSTGCIVMFAEYTALYGGLVERLLLREYPEYYDAVISLNKRVFPNWLDFHNHFTKDNITLILPLREYQMALLAAQGVPFKKIAPRFNMTYGAFNNKMQEIYQKLFISSKKELPYFIL